MWLLFDFRRVIFPDPVTLNLLAAVLFVLIFGILLLSKHPWPWLKNHDHQLAVQTRRSLNGANVVQFLGKRVHFAKTDFRVGDFSGSELTRHFDLVSLFDELPRVACEGGQVIFSRARTHLYTLNLLLRAFPFLFLLLLGQVFELAVVDDFAHGRLRLGRNHDKVQPGFTSHVKGLSALDDADLPPIGADDTEVAEPKAPLVDRRALFTLRGSSESCYRQSPL